MTRLVKLIASCSAALLLGAVALQPAFAASTPTPPPTTGSTSTQTLEAQLQQQEQTVNHLADQVEDEQATVNRLNGKVASDKKQEALLNQRMDQVARVEYERPALSLTTVLDAQNLNQLLTGVAQARLVARQQQQLYAAAARLQARDQADRAAARAQLAKISAQKQQASSIAANTLAEITTLESEESGSSTTSSGSSSSYHSPVESSEPVIVPAAGITLKMGGSDPNQFVAGQCTWYVASIYQVPWTGNANQWPAGAAADGQAEGQTPLVGAIMESADSWYGHVSVVTSVTDNDDWTVTEMNYMGEYVIDTRQVTRSSSNLVTFIY